MCLPVVIAAPALHLPTLQGACQQMRTSAAETIESGVLRFKDAAELGASLEYTRPRNPYASGGVAGLFEALSRWAAHRCGRHAQSVRANAASTRHAGHALRGHGQGKRAVRARRARRARTGRCRGL